MDAVSAEKKEYSEDKQHCKNNMQMKCIIASRKQNEFET